MRHEALAMVGDFFLSKRLRQPLCPGGLDSWPARLVDSWAVLEAEFDAWRRQRAGPSR